MTEETKRNRPKRTNAHSLKTIQHVGIEMARVYRSMKRGDYESSHGYRLVMVLAAIRQCLESSEVERRLAEIETAIANRDNITHLRPRVVG